MQMRINNLRSVSFRAGKKHGDTMFSLSLQGHHYQLHHTAGLRLRLTKETKLLTVLASWFLKYTSWHSGWSKVKTP